MASYVRQNRVSDPWASKNFAASSPASLILVSQDRSSSLWTEPSTILSHGTQPQGFGIHGWVSSPILLLLRKYRHKQLWSGQAHSAELLAPPQQSGPILGATEWNSSRLTLSQKEAQVRWGSVPGGSVKHTPRAGLPDSVGSRRRAPQPSLRPWPRYWCTHGPSEGRAGRRDCRTGRQLHWVGLSLCRGQLLLCLGTAVQPRLPQQKSCITGLWAASAAVMIAFP